MAIHSFCNNRYNNNTNNFVDLRFKTKKRKEKNIWNLLILLNNIYYIYICRTLFTQLTDRRPRGRSRTRWIDRVKEIIHNVDPSASIEDAVDREKWKIVCNCCLVWTSMVCSTNKWWWWYICYWLHIYILSSYT